MTTKRIRSKASKKVIDDSLSSLSENSDESIPEIYAISTKKGIPRRHFFKEISHKVAGVAAMALLGNVITSCEDTYEIEIEKDSKKCTCHVVCTCNTVDDEKSNSWDQQWTGSYCSCNTICTCNSVCTCNSDGSGGGGGGGGSYWYPN